METKAEVWIPLTQGKVTVIDFDDLEKVRGIKWQAKKNGNSFYAESSFRVGKEKRYISLHRLLMDARRGELVDHNDGDGLNNRRDNMRIATKSQNAQNQRPQKRRKSSSAFKGVCWDKPSRKWRAQIESSKRKKFIGHFDSEEAAALAYDSAALQCFGEFARLNFPTKKDDKCLTKGGSLV